MEKNKNGIITMLVVLVIILAVLCTLFATDKINLKSSEEDIISSNISEEDIISSNISEENSNNSMNNSYKSVAGVYKATYNKSNGDPNMECTNRIHYGLKLYDNGIFTYIKNMCTSFGFFGNYIINGNKIILTNWFSTGNGTGFDVKKMESIVLTIDDDGNVIDNNTGSIISDLKELKLIKSNKKDGINYVADNLQDMSYVDYYLSNIEYVELNN